MKGVEPALPEHAVLREPLVHLDERLRTEAVDPALRLRAYVDQPGLPQHPQMPRHARTGDRDRLRQLPRARRVIAQDLQHRSPALVRQGVQHRIHTPNVTDRVRIRKVTYAPSGRTDAHSRVRPGAPSATAERRTAPPRRRPRSGRRTTSRWSPAPPSGG